MPKSVKMQILVGLVVPMWLVCLLFTAPTSQQGDPPPPPPGVPPPPGINVAPNNGPPGACEYLDLVSNPLDACSPCENDKWFELILNQRADTYTETHCFNSYPLGTNFLPPCPKDLTKGKVHPELDISKNRRGFIISKLPFFRYNTNLPDTVKCTDNAQCPSHCLITSTTATTIAPPTIAPPTTDPTVVVPPGGNSNSSTAEENLDVGRVEAYYKYKNSGKIGSTIDFQILEWPGRDSIEQRKFLEKKLNMECKEGELFRSDKPYLCSITDEDKRNFVMLKFHRESSKLLHYPCNTEEGTNIVVLGLMAVNEEEEDEENPHNKIFFSYANQSILDAPTQPLYVSENILNLMARPSDSEPKGVCRVASEEPKDCDFTKDLVDPLTETATDCEWRQKYFLDRGDIFMKKENCNPFKNENMTTDCLNCKISKALTGDLRTVLDFTFVQGRLLLAMRCGILVVTGFLNKRPDIRPASLLSSVGKSKNSFPPINKISSSYCCEGSACRRTIIAAYSSYQNRPVGVPKELFVSFNLGETFQVKLLIEPSSALNLIWGMHKLYGEWLLYHQLLETPDTEDLRDDHGNELHAGYIDLQSIPDWGSLTLAKKEKRLLYGETTSKAHITDITVRKRALRKYVKLRTDGALRRFVRYRGLGREINLDLSPRWLQQEIGNFRKRAPITWEKSWTDANCDSIPKCRKHFVNDQAVEYFLKDSGVIVKTPKKAVEESFCDQIMSINVLQEEDSLYIICRVGFGDFSRPFKKGSDPDVKTSCSSRESAGEQDLKPNCSYPLDSTVKKGGQQQGKQPKEFVYNVCANPVKFYAVYSLSVKEKLPFVLINERRSERLFTCKQVETTLDWYGCKNLDVQPELVRVPLSITLLVKNCKDVLYFSPNGGRTMFNTQFYAVQDQFAGLYHSVSDSCRTDNCEPSSTNSTSYKRQLMYRLKSLDVAPLISISPDNDVVFMTMRNMYAYGLLGINREFTMIVGEIFPDIESTIISKIKSNDFVFPDFTHSSLPFFAVALKLIYSYNKVISCKLYSNRHGIRLNRMDFFFFKDVSYFYEGSKDLDSQARSSGLSAAACHTYQFSADPTSLVLDVGETGVVAVTVYDPQPNIPLGLVSSEEKSITVLVSFVDRSRKEKEHLAHDWDIHVRSIQNYKPRKDALVDSFFGAENNNMYGFYTEVGLASNVEFRCHVQPSETVSVFIGCQKKKLVVHEDEYRPQCIHGTFSKSSYEYRLKKGDFDPNLAGYWIDLDESEGKNLIKLDRATGDLVIVYDYLKFGCPLEPYKDVPFIPDLRVATADTQYNSSYGEKYNGSFLLIELFGAKGFSFTQTYKDYGCTFVPMNITNATEAWVHRQRMFRIAYGRQISVSDIRDIYRAQTIEDLDNLERGNRLFVPDAVDHPINIINRVTYRDCRKWRSFFIESENSSEHFLDNLSQEERERHEGQQLQIMRRKLDDDDKDEINQLRWNKKSQEVYIFMAVALDPTESLCEYYTIFGVHLPELSEVNGLRTLFVFIFLVILWILIFTCGYLCRKRRIRTLCIELERRRRLEEAAWKTVFQYERLLQENENWKIEEEFQQISENMIMSENLAVSEEIQSDISSKCKQKCKEDPKKCKHKRSKRTKDNSLDGEN